MTKNNAKRHNFSLDLTLKWSKSSFCCKNVSFRLASEYPNLHNLLCNCLLDTISLRSHLKAALSLKSSEDTKSRANCNFVLGLGVKSVIIIFPQFFIDDSAMPPTCLSFPSGITRESSKRHFGVAKIRKKIDIPKKLLFVGTSPDFVVCRLSFCSASEPPLKKL